MYQQPPQQPDWQQQPQYYQQPGQEPYQPQSPPPKKSRRRLWLILGIVGGLLIVSCVTCGVIAAFNPTPPAAATPTSVAQAQAPTSTPTLAPTAHATTVPTATATRPAPTATHASGLTATHGTPRLGGPVSDFVGKYGQPDTGCATCTAGVYNFQRIQGTQIDYISTMLTDANGHVNGFIVQALSGDWDASTASAVCASFGPSDANYSHASQVLSSSDGSSVEKVYKSAWLAGQLAPGDFTDGSSGNTLTPGTFDITYTYDGSPSKVSDCSLEAGIQQV